MNIRQRIASHVAAVLIFFLPATLPKDVFMKYFPKYSFESEPMSTDISEWVQYPDGSESLRRSGWIVWTAPGGLVMVQRLEPGELSPDDARTLASALLDAAEVAEGD